jgi:hypothetical protein
MIIVKKRELRILAEDGVTLLPNDFGIHCAALEAAMTLGEWPELVSRLPAGLSLSQRLTNCIVDELYHLFCTEDERYAEVRGAGKSFTKHCLPTVAGFVAGSVGVTEAMASSAIAFVTLAVFKVGRNAFCVLKSKSHPTAKNA